MLATPMKFCGNPEDLIGDRAESVTVSGYTPPAVEGSTVTFHCLPGAVLHGINSSICVENGEWEPALKEVKCSSQCNKSLPRARMRSRGKAIVCLSVSMSAQESSYLEIYHNKSVKTFEKLTLLCFKSFGRAHKRRKHCIFVGHAYQLHPFCSCAQLA